MVVQVLFTTGAFAIYVQTGTGKYSFRGKFVFGWAGVSRLLLRADGGQFSGAAKTSAVSIVVLAYKYVMDCATYAITKLFTSKISIAGTSQLDLGEAVRSHVYSNDVSSIFLSGTSFTQFDCQTKVAVVGAFLGDGEVLSKVDREGGCEIRVWRQHPGWVGQGAYAASGTHSISPDIHCVRLL